MKKILFIILCLIFCSTWRFTHAAERANISVIFSSDLMPYKQTLKGLKKLFVEKGIQLKISKYNLQREKPDLIIHQIFQEKPDIVYTVGTKASMLAKERIKETPIVFSMVLQAETFINSNIAGISLNIPVEMKLENIRRILPSVKRIGVIYSSKFTKLYDKVSTVSREMGFELVAKHINSKSGFSEALKDISSQIDCFLLIPDIELYIPQSISHLILEGLHNNFSVIGLSSFHTKAGALISFEGDYYDMGKQAGEIALKILEGKQSTHTQSVMPRKTNFSLNLLIAERLDMKIPSKRIKEASEVFGK